MKTTLTLQLIPGMVTATDVYNYNHQLLFTKGTVLTDSAIAKLELYSIPYIEIEEKAVPPVPASVPVSSYAQRVQNSAEFKEFKANYTHKLSAFEASMNDLLLDNAEIDVQSLLDDVLGLFSTSQGNVSIFDMLHNMRTYDDATFSHSLNVALICHVFAKWLHMSEDNIHMATLCGLLHDIGKLLTPVEIITKPDRLSSREFDIMKRHPVDGYQILRRLKLNEHICNAALMHHEKCDSTGYPFGIAGKQIDSFAQMVTIADIYDATTSARIYRGPMCPFKVVELLESESLQKYHPQYIMTFLENITNTYILNRVRLNNGVEGDIIYINKDRYSRPVIKTGSDSYLNLMEYPSLSIEYIL